MCEALTVGESAWGEAGADLPHPHPGGIERSRKCVVFAGSYVEKTWTKKGLNYSRFL
jgi:hypothetical protein